MVALLGVIEGLAARVQQQDEEIALLKDEIRMLKGGKKRPHFKPSQMEEQTEGGGARGERATKDQRRPGSDKSCTQQDGRVGDSRRADPAAEGSDPEGLAFQRLSGHRHSRLGDPGPQHALPVSALADTEGRLCERGVASAFGGPSLWCDAARVHVCSSACRVAKSPSSLLREQLRKWGIDISSGAINALLSAGGKVFHAQEKDGLLNTALATARYVTVDDSGARHRGQKGVVTHIGNADFAWFGSTESKSWIGTPAPVVAGGIKYQSNHAALSYMREQDVAHTPENTWRRPQSPLS